MAYEIPQELEYQERIVFNLTFAQMFYALLFSPIVIGILFKLPIGIAYRVAIALLPSSLACVFMFTDLPKKFWNWWKWRSYKEFKLEDKKMKEFFNLEKVE